MRTFTIRFGSPLGALALTVAAVAAVGCGADGDGGDSFEVDSSVVRVDGAPSPDASPVPDAARPDGGPDEGPDGGGGSDDVCSGEDEGDTESAAEAQGAIGDCDAFPGNEPLAMEGELGGRTDIDWFQIDGEDRSASCTTDPGVEMETEVEDVRLCMYAACEGLNVACEPFEGEEEATSPEGRSGCCSTDGSVDFPVDCEGGDDSAEVYISVDNGTGDQCVPYSLSFHY